MAMGLALIPKSHLGFIFLIILSTIPSFAVSKESDSPTVYDILSKFGLPIGLLPDSVTSYTLSSDGRFVVHLAKPCYVHFEYYVYYDKTITGKLSYGSISDLDGIEVQKFFLWLDVKEIRVDLPTSRNIYFHVGFINKKLDIDQFSTIRSCEDNSLGSCFASLKQILELPPPVDEIQMLITE